MPITTAALPCWMTTERPCRRNYKECGSPVSALILHPRKWPQTQILLRSGWPPGQVVAGAEKNVLWLLAFLASLAANPASSAARVMWDGAKVSGHVASQTSFWPFFEGITEFPSGCLPLEHATPVGSSRGTLAEASDACLGWRSRLFVQLKQRNTVHYMYSWRFL